MRVTFKCHCGMLILASVATIGCGDDDPVAPQVGTITVNLEPNNINATWQMTGPNGFAKSAAGDATLSDMAAGSYTFTWGAVSGWTRPSPAAVTRTLSQGGVVTIAGLYVVNGGTPGGFASVPAGTFMMGYPTSKLDRDTNATQHQVTLTHGFYMQTTEVTNQQYSDMAQWAYDNGYVTVTAGYVGYVCDNLDGSTQELHNAASYEVEFSGGVFLCIHPDHPVKFMNWYGSAAYCDWLSLQQGLPRAYNHSTWQCNAGNPYAATGYRLPTDAEWEYACRSGTQTPFSTGSCLDAGTEANYNGGYPYTGCPTGPYIDWTVSVGSYPANAFGLYDMHGNLGEWCNDWFGLYGGTVTDPVGPGAGSDRVIRGGNWNSSAEFCHSAFRYAGPNDTYFSSTLGFRPVRTAN